VEGRVVAASVRIEDEAFSDRRYDRLARAAGLADADHARGKMAVIWRQCTIEQTHILPADDVTDVLGPNGIVALELARLGERVDTGVRICGTRGRIEWLKKLRDNGKFGKKGGRPRRNPQGLGDGNPSGSPSGNGDQTPPAPAPAPAPANKEESTSDKPDPGLAFAEKAIAEINRHAGTKYRPDSAAVLKLIKALIRNRHTPEQAEQVIASKRAWVGDPKMGQFFRPATLLAPSNFANYLADLEAGPPFSQGTKVTRLAAPDDDEPQLGHLLMLGANP
jgi:uncharacterized phage protein (TIGR02220 family)